MTVCGVCVPELHLSQRMMNARGFATFGLVPISQLTHATRLICHRDGLGPAHIRKGAGLTPCHICTGTRLTPLHTRTGALVSQLTFYNASEPPTWRHRTLRFSRSRWGKGGDHEGQPVVEYTSLVDGTFSEAFELEHFPFGARATHYACLCVQHAAWHTTSDCADADVQPLRITVTTTLPGTSVQLRVDNYDFTMSELRVLTPSQWSSSAWLPLRMHVCMPCGQVDKKSINEFELLLPDNEGEASPNSSDLILYTQMLRFTGESYSMIHFCVIAKRRPYYYFISVCLQHRASQVVCCTSVP